MLKISEDSKYYDNYKKKRGDSTFTSSDILCTPYNYNEYYDVHYLLTSFLDLYIPDDLLEWIVKLFPKELIPNINSDSYEFSNSSSFTETEIDSFMETESNSISKYTYTQSEIETTSDYSSDYYSESDYMYKGRIINGVENLFKLPTPKELLLNSFFKEFLEKPQDFDENECLFFKFNF
jgi:hypothetical protein